MEGVIACDDDPVVYLYGFVPRATAMPPIEGVEPDSPVFFIESGDLACAASLVPSHRYAHPHDGQTAEQAEWVTRRALRHHEVLGRLQASGAVLPLKFGATCPTANDVRLLLQDRRGAITELLEKFAGKDEWTLKITVDDAAVAARCEAESPELMALKQAEASLPEGRAYFARKQRLKITAALVAESIAAVEDAAYRRLARLDIDIVRSSRNTAAALLVPRSTRDALETALAELQAEHADCGLAFELVGPWPPYSFATTLGQD